MDYKKALLKNGMTNEDIFNQGIDYFRKKKYKMAVMYFEKGYNMKDSDCAISFAICLFKEYGIKKNEEKAIAILDKYRHFVKDNDAKHICYKIIGDYFYKKAICLIKNVYGGLNKIDSIFYEKIPKDIEKYVLSFTTINKKTLSINHLLEKVIDYHNVICNIDNKALKKHNHCIELYKKINKRLPFVNLFFD